uniref:Paired box 8 n=1 Tax=Scleropages formosus TaxID=113540 RepID=A0A8D0CJI3_SCLFO
FLCNTFRPCVLCVPTSLKGTHTHTHTHTHTRARSNYSGAAYTHSPYASYAEAWRFTGTRILGSPFYYSCASRAAPSSTAGYDHP